MKRQKLITYLDSYLDIANINDYGPQGLQLEADNEEINKIALTVDVSIAGISSAVAWGADMLLVHHGILWRSVERLAGPLGARVRLMLKHGINLYAAHLPLDAHPEVGNNAFLAQKMGVDVQQWWGTPTGVPIAVLGELPTPMPRADFLAKVNSELGTNARLLPHGTENVQTVAILSGDGIGYISEVKALGADTFLTGETDHASYWSAADYKLNVIYAGHYATETVGVRALGKHLEEKFGVETKFFDFPTNM